MLLSNTCSSKQWVQRIRCKRIRPVPNACPTSISTVRLLCEERANDFVPRAIYSDAASLPEPQWHDNQLRWKQPPNLTPVEAPPGSPPVVILPGFGNATSDYTALFGNQEAALVSRLAARGWRSFVVPLERKDWFQVARGLLTRRYWQGGLTTNPGYTWYLERVAATVELALQETGAEQVVLVCHSAGGWLGRAYLADPRYQHPQQVQAQGQQPSEGAGAMQAPPPPGTAGSTPNPRVRALVTLGTPQRPPPPEKKRDMTGGAQGWVDRTYPGAFFSDRGVAYVCVCGRTVRGHRDFPRVRKGPRVPEEYAYDSYTEVCGEGEGVAGDCVVPLGSALLPGARQVVLDGVYHSMSRIGTFDEESGVVWYGSEDVVDAWLGPLLEELEAGKSRPVGGSARGKAGEEEDEVVEAAVGAGKRT